MYFSVQQGRALEQGLLLPGCGGLAAQPSTSTQPVPVVAYPGPHGPAGGRARVAGGKRRCRISAMNVACADWVQPSEDGATAGQLWMV